MRYGIQPQVSSSGLTSAVAGDAAGDIHPQDGGGWLSIGCDACPHSSSQGDACADCAVAFICDRDVDDALVVDVHDAAEERALRLLDEAGLLAEVISRGDLVAEVQVA